jgi:hypothetical protein
MGMVGYMSLDGPHAHKEAKRGSHSLRGALWHPLNHPPQPQKLVDHELQFDMFAFCCCTSRNLSHHPLSRVLHEPVVEFPEFLGT